MLPLLNRPIPLVADPWAKPELGSGCVKITPAHDPNDYEVGLRHALPMVNILRPDGTLNENAGAALGEPGIQHDNSQFNWIGAIAATFYGFPLARPIFRLLGPPGIQIVSRAFGLILASIAVHGLIMAIKLSFNLPG